MDKRTVLKTIDNFKKKLEEKSIRVKKIVLYGSFATGKDTEISDIDLVVISDDFKGKSYWERIDLLSDAIYEVMKPIEAVAMTSEEWEKDDSMIVDFARKGEVVFAW
jgi:predicted nucleotidyltransferase